MPFFVKKESGWNWNPNILLEWSSKAIAALVDLHRIVMSTEEEKKGSSDSGEEDFLIDVNDIWIYI